VWPTPVRTLGFGQCAVLNRIYNLRTRGRPSLASPVDGRAAQAVRDNHMKAAAKNDKQDLG
jgi:hypothetical protein